MRNYKILQILSQNFILPKKQKPGPKKSYHLELERLGFENDGNIFLRKLGGRSDPELGSIFKGFRGFGLS